MLKCTNWDVNRQLNNVSTAGPEKKFQAIHH